MNSLPSARRLLPPSWRLLPLLVLACGGPNNPGQTQPDLPQVSVLVDETNTVGRSVRLSISVSGCSKVQKLELFDNDTLLKVVPYTASPTPVELTSEELKYPQGLAANLALLASVTCDDGRKNVSQAQLATFMPVAEVIDPPSEGEQVVPDYFAVDGSGDSATFIGCGVENNVPKLYRVKKSDPTHYDSLDMPFTCDASTTVTERKPASRGTRWIWTSGKQGLAMDVNFKRLGDTGVTSTKEHLALNQLTVAPDGSAIVDDGNDIQRVLTTGVVKWTGPKDAVSNAGELLGEPVVRSSSDEVVVARKEQSASENAVDVRVAVYAFSTGELKKTYRIAHISHIQNVMGVFNATGSVLYLSLQGDTTALVEACAIGVPDLCQAGTTPKSRLWVSDALQGNIVALLPYSNGTRLAAITSNRYWFLDAQSSSSTAGKVVNKGQMPLTPNGALMARFIQPGLNDGSFYIFNSGQGTSSTPYPAPVELMATDSAEKGLLYRYQTSGSSLFGALDEAGTLWLRVGRKLVRPMTPAQYRQLVP